jgi:hypothetical protein
MRPIKKHIITDDFTAIPFVMTAAVYAGPHVLLGGFPLSTACYSRTSRKDASIQKTES